MSGGEDRGTGAGPAPLDAAAALRLALALSLGAAVSLGITRFAYGLLLPPMRDDLGWSYTLAGAMNTANALGYLLGALAAPRLLQRVGAGRTMVAGAACATLFMASCGFFADAAALLVQRLLAGVASACVFVAGGWLAARLGTLRPGQGGLLLGLYYGGTGFGIVLSALLVPVALEAAAGRPHAWAWAWWALAAGCAAATAVLRWPAWVLAAAAGPAVAAAGGVPAERMFAPRAFGWALAGYGCFGAGYIGYMTFVVALLRTQGVSPGAVTLFYALLGAATVASSWVWARLLDRHRGGGALARLNALLGLAALLPAVTGWWPALLASGIVFGGVFLSVVASTTALVRHNLPAAQWARGIGAFTVVFAAGQIAGPTVVGWVADGAGGLTRGLAVSACTLWLGAALAWRQRPLSER